MSDILSAGALQDTLRESKSFSQQATFSLGSGKQKKRKTKTMVKPIEDILIRKSKAKVLRQSNTDIGGLTARFGMEEGFDEGITNCKSPSPKGERISLPSVFSRRESIDKTYFEDENGAGQNLPHDTLFSGEAISTEEESERFQNSRQQTSSRESKLIDLGLVTFGD